MCRSVLSVSFLIFLVLSSCFLCATQKVNAQYLEKQLLAEPVEDLTKAALKEGDAERGAIVFFQPHMACNKCHSIGDEENSLGPSLVKFDTETSDAHLVESILHPSKSIRKGFEAATVITLDGKTQTGLLVEDDKEKVVVRDISRNELVTFARDDVDDVVPSKLSVMPVGQVNQLTSRQQFLDLVRYLIEIKQGGAKRAFELTPPPHLIVARPLPEYEKRVDHAEMIRTLDATAFKRGKAIYQQLCVNCHGTHDRPGSLPTSLRFASGSFKSGNDPFTMYQTLTRGFGLMLPQQWMVPQQKYDVIHYIREDYLKKHNPSQYAKISEDYLAALPAGDTRGPKPRKIEPWATMDYGPHLVNTIEVGNDASNFAYKGIAIRLDTGPGGIAHGQHWMMFDHDTFRIAAAWSRSTKPDSPAFIDWRGIHFNGNHGIHPRVAGDVKFENPNGPGWAEPGTGSFDDPRLVGRDGRKYGPLPREWAQLKGIYVHGQRTILSYSVGKTTVLELSGLIDPNANDPTKGAEQPTAAGQPVVFTRSFNIGPRDHDMLLLVATDRDATLVDAKKQVISFGREMPLLVGLSRLIDGCQWVQRENRLCLSIPAGSNPLRFQVWTARANESAEFDSSDLDPPKLWFRLRDAEPNLRKYLNGGSLRWPQKVKTQAIIGKADGPFAIDTLTVPSPNPWLARVRCTGHDFFPDGDRAVVCTWDGDVWVVSGLKALQKEVATAELTWQRIASGLFQPLGVKWIDGRVYLTCRDQICILNDFNNDGETDFYECFNADAQVTDHFHEFAMGLQVDDEGNLYYARSARHAKTALVPHHGTLLKVAKDGSKTEIIANGFRAANGVCLNPDGTFIVTDQEGHWNPKNRINWVKPGGFYGNMYGYHNVTDTSDKAMNQPLCWITNAFDRSPAELLWGDSEKWGPLDGKLLNFSYGYGKVYIVPHEEVQGQMQGGMCAFPIPQFPTGVMRGRFSPHDGQLYASGMFAWAGSQQESPGGFYRLRYTGKPVHLPVELNATKKGMRITFSGGLDREEAGNPDNYSVKVWSLKRTRNYGSRHYDERSLEVERVEVGKDGKSVMIVLPEIEPTWCMEIRYRLRSDHDKAFDGVIHNTIYHLGEPPG